jgi:hypothetical protein
MWPSIPPHCVPGRKRRRPPRRQACHPSRPIQHGPLALGPFAPAVMPRRVARWATSRRIPSRAHRPWEVVSHHSMVGYRSALCDATSRPSAVRTLAARPDTPQANPRIIRGWCQVRQNQPRWTRPLLPTHQPHACPMGQTPRPAACRSSSGPTHGPGDGSTAAEAT